LGNQHALFIPAWRNMAGAGRWFSWRGGDPFALWSVRLRYALRQAEDENRFLRRWRALYHPTTAAPGIDAKALRPTWLMFWRPISTANLWPQFRRTGDPACHCFRVGAGVVCGLDLDPAARKGWMSTACASVMLVSALIVTPLPFVLQLDSFWPVAIMRAS
jgi:hypothetical protein